MDTERALRFLSNHQPMPPDGEITPGEADTFVEILKHFETFPDHRCVPLLIRSVSMDTGLGMYEHIQFVLQRQSRQVVVQNLREALENGSRGVKYRACWWAADIEAWNELADVISPLLEHDDADVKAAAEAFIELRDELH